MHLHYFNLQFGSKILIPSSFTRISSRFLKKRRWKEASRSCSIVLILIARNRETFILAVAFFFINSHFFTKRKTKPQASLFLCYNYRTNEQPPSKNTHWLCRKIFFFSAILHFFDGWVLFFFSHYKCFTIVFNLSQQYKMKLIKI